MLLQQHPKVGTIFRVTRLKIIYLELTRQLVKLINRISKEMTIANKNLNNLDHPKENQLNGCLMNS